MTETTAPILKDKLTDLLPDGLEPLSSLLAADESACRWPTTLEMCCGRKKKFGSPYCEEHWKRAHRPGAAPVSFSMTKRPGTRLGIVALAVLEKI